LSLLVWFVETDKPSFGDGVLAALVLLDSLCPMMTMVVALVVVIMMS